MSQAFTARNNHYKNTMLVTDTLKCNRGRLDVGPILQYRHVPGETGLVSYRSAGRGLVLYV